MEDNMSSVDQSNQSILYRVFAWMGVAVGLSGVTAWLLAEYSQTLLLSPWMFFALFLVQMTIVIVLSSQILTLSYAAAQILFVLYAVTTGATLSVLFLVYTIPSLVQTFFIAASMFASMAIYGAYTKTDLSGLRSLLMMTLWGVIIALLVNIFLQSAFLDMITALVGVLLFSLLTAFDIQRISVLVGYLSERREEVRKIALLGALQLYLDFINLFLSLLRLGGNRK